MNQRDVFALKPEPLTYLAARVRAPRQAWHESAKNKIVYVIQHAYPVETPWVLTDTLYVKFVEQGSYWHRAALYHVHNPDEVLYSV